MQISRIQCRQKNRNYFNIKFKCGCTINYGAAALFFTIALMTDDGVNRGRILNPVLISLHHPSTRYELQTMRKLTG
jgi:hypothetical protein